MLVVQSLQLMESVRKKVFKVREPKITLILEYGIRFLQIGAVLP